MSVKAVVTSSSSIQAYEAWKKEAEKQLVAKGFPNPLAALVISYEISPNTTLTKIWGENWIHNNRTLKTFEQQENEIPGFIKEEISGLTKKGKCRLFHSVQNKVALMLQERDNTPCTTRLIASQLAQAVFKRVVFAFGKQEKRSIDLNALSMDRRDVYLPMQKGVIDLLTVYDLKAGVVYIEDAPDFKCDEELNALVKKDEVQTLLKTTLAKVKT